MKSLKDKGVHELEVTCKFRVVQKFMMVQNQLATAFEEQAEVI